MPRTSMYQAALARTSRTVRPRWCTPLIMLGLPSRSARAGLKVGPVHIDRYVGVVVPHNIPARPRDLARLHVQTQLKAAIRAYPRDRDRNAAAVPIVEVVDDALP